MSMMVNPFRFGPAGAPSGWETISDGTFGSASNNWHNWTIRAFISRSLLPAGATKVRITFGSSSLGGLKIGAASIGASRALVYDVAPTPLLFGGAAGTTIVGANNTVETDELDFSYNGLNDLCISMYVAADAATGSLNTMGLRGGIAAVLGGNITGGDQTAALGGTWSSTSSIYGIRKIEVFTGGTWKNLLRSHSGYLTNWNNYTLRSLIALDQLNISRNTLRFGFAYRLTEAFVGNSAGGASPFDFDATPIRLTFGGANGTGTQDFYPYITDDFDYTLLDPAKPLLLSTHTATTRIAHRSSPPTGQSSRYKAGNSVSAVSWQTGSDGWGTYLGPQFVDEKY